MLLGIQKVHIRSAQSDDRGQCAEIHTKARAQMEYLPALYSPKQVRDWMSGVVFKNETVIVAEEEGSVVGYASYTAELISNLYVLPKFQRRGVGTALLQHVLRDRPNGISLWVFEQNTGAIRFYESNGFETVTRTSGENNEEGLPDRLMKLGG